MSKITHVVRLHSVPPADTVIGRLLYGRRPKGIAVTNSLFPMILLRGTDLRASFMRGDYYVVDFFLEGGSLEDLQAAVGAIGGKRGRIETFTNEEWMAEN